MIAFVSVKHTDKPKKQGFDPKKFFVDLATGALLLQYQKLQLLPLKE